MQTLISKTITIVNFFIYHSFPPKAACERIFEPSLTVFARFSENKKGAKSQAYVLKALVTR